MADVLVTGTEGWAVGHAAQLLRDAGFTVATCHDEGAPLFPCRGLTGDGRCPIDDGVNVVLTVRPHPLPQLTRREVGVICGLRAGLPLVVAGSTVLHPFADHATEVVEGLDGADLAAACERAIGALKRSRS